LATILLLLAESRRELSAARPPLALAGALASIFTSFFNKLMGQPLRHPVRWGIMRHQVRRGYDACTLHPQASVRKPTSSETQHHAAPGHGASLQRRCSDLVAPGSPRHASPRSRAMHMPARSLASGTPATPPARAPPSWSTPTTILINGNPLGRSAATPAVAALNFGAINPPPRPLPLCLWQRTARLAPRNARLPTGREAVHRCTDAPAPPDQLTVEQPLPSPAFKLA
jgi:hypothetical protein